LLELQSDDWRVKRVGAHDMQFEDAKLKTYLEVWLYKLYCFVKYFLFKKYINNIFYFLKIIFKISSLKYLKIKKIY
jgi:hypothetical protein